MDSQLGRESVVLLPIELHWWWLGASAKKLFNLPPLIFHTFWICCPELECSTILNSNALRCLNQKS